MINFSIKIQIGTTLYNYYIENEKDIKFEEKDHENIIERRRFFVGKLKISRTLNPEIWDKINLEEFWNENYVNFYISENSNVRLHYRGKFKYSEFEIDYDNCTFDIVNMINADKYSNMLSLVDSTFLRLTGSNDPPDDFISQRRSYFFATATDINTTKNGYTMLYLMSPLFRIWITEIIKVLPDGHYGYSWTDYETRVSTGDVTDFDWIKDTDALQWFRPMKTSFFGLGYANSQLTPDYVFMGRENIATVGGSDIWINTLISNVQDNSRYACTIKGYTIGHAMQEILGSSLSIDSDPLQFNNNYVFDTLFISSVEFSNRSQNEQNPNKVKFEVNLKRILKILHQFGYYYMLKESNLSGVDYDFIVKPYPQWYPQTSTGLDLTNTGFNQPNKFSFDEKITSEMTFKFKKGSGSFEQAIALFFESELEKETVTFDFITDILGVHLDDEKNLDLVIYAANFGYSQYQGVSLSIETNNVLNTFNMAANYYRFVRQYMTRWYELNGITTNTGGYEKKIKKAATIKVPMCIGDIIDKKVATTKLGTGEITKVTQTINDNMYAIEINY